MRYVLFLLLVWILPVSAQHDTFEIPLQIRLAGQYIKADRFRDAEKLLLPVYQETRALAEQHPDQTIKVLEMLATSRSQQGKHDSVVDLLLEQHRFIATHYHEHGAAFAASLARLAEAHYRDGQKYNAIEFVQRSFEIYQKLNPAPQDTLKTLRGNLAQYRIAPFSEKFLPRDLSEFYTRCERLQRVNSTDNVTAIMREFVEVGVDYHPSGSWDQYFKLLRQSGSQAGVTPFERADSAQVSKQRRIFLPDRSLWQRDELCIVDVADGVVVNAMTELE